MLVIAHRGRIGNVPENTLAGLQTCMEAGVLWAEVDVRSTADGYHVLMHDVDLRRTLARDDRVSDLTLEALQAMSSQAGPAMRVATLAEAFEMVRGRLGLYLDCRGVDPLRLLDAVCKTGMRAHTLVTFELEVFRTLGQDATRGFNIVAPWTGPDEHPEQTALGLHASVLEIPASVAERNLIARARAAGLEVECLTLRHEDVPAQWSRCRELGVDYLMTDRPVEADRFARG